MSFLRNLKSAFGFGPSDAEEDDRLLADDNATSDLPDNSPAKAETSDGPALPEAPSVDPKAVQSVFSTVVAVFNNALPEFISSSVDPKAQEEYLYRSLEQSMKDYFTKLMDDARVYAEASVRQSNHEAVAELARLRQEKQNLEQQRSSIKEQQLSADRRRRALADRVQDLEAQVASLEAEREQFDLENKSLLNKIKLSEIQPAVVEELSAEIERLRGQLASGESAPAEDYTIMLKDRDARIAELEAALADRDEARRTSADMFNSLQHEMVDERRKAAAEAEALKARIEEAAAQAEDARRAIADKDAQLEEASRLLKGMEQLTAQMQQVETAITKRDDRIKALQHKNRDLRQRLDKAEKRLAGKLTPSLPFGAEDPDTPYGSDMIATQPIKPEDFADDDFQPVDWLTGTPPKGTIVRSELTDEEFGYQEPPRKPKAKDHDSQLSLF